MMRISVWVIGLLFLIVPDIILWFKERVVPRMTYIRLIGVIGLGLVLFFVIPLMPDDEKRSIGVSFIVVSLGSTVFRIFTELRGK
jgi:hypothetical protein